MLLVDIIKKIKKPNKIKKQSFEERIIEVLKEEKRKIISFGQNYLEIREGMTEENLIEQIKNMYCEKYRLGFNFDVKEIGSFFGLEESKYINIENEMIFLKDNIEYLTNNLASKNTRTRMSAKADLLVGQHHQLSEMRGRLSFEIKLTDFSFLDLIEEERQHLIKEIFEATDFYPDGISNRTIKKKMNNCSLAELNQKSNYEIAKTYRDIGLDRLTWDY